MLFIAAGAFHVSKVSDLIPELQGRFPVHVHLQSLSRDDFRKILTTPDNALTKQYHALLEVDKVLLKFDESAIDAIAEAACNANENAEDIGADGSTPSLNSCWRMCPSTRAMKTCLLSSW